MMFCIFIGTLLPSSAVDSELNKIQPILLSFVHRFLLAFLLFIVVCWNASHEPVCHFVTAFSILVPRVNLEVQSFQESSASPEAFSP